MYLYLHICLMYKHTRRRSLSPPARSTTASVIYKRQAWHYSKHDNDPTQNKTGSQHLHGPTRVQPPAAANNTTTPHKKSQADKTYSSHLDTCPHPRDRTRSRKTTTPWKTKHTHTHYTHVRSRRNKHDPLRQKIINKKHILHTILYNPPHTKTY